MVYQTLGSRLVTATLDKTGMNTTFWTAQFTDQIQGIDIPVYELYHIYISTTQLVTWSQNPISGQFQVWLNNVPWDNVPYSANNSWDPAQPMILRSGDEIDFFFSFSTAPAPVVTCWFRYDDGT